MFARLCSMPHDSCVSGTGEVQFGASDLIASAYRLTYKSWAPEQHQIRFDIPVRILLKHKKTADGKSSGLQLKPADILVFQPVGSPVLFIRIGLEFDPRLKFCHTVTKSLNQV
jgi:hypothetical protein